jgi:hypothetical protein
MLCKLIFTNLSSLRVCVNTYVVWEYIICLRQYADKLKKGKVLATEASVVDKQPLIFFLRPLIHYH